MIEDNPGDVELVREMLGEARDARFVLNYTDRLSTDLKLLAEKNFDLLLLDLSLPDSRGLETFEKAHIQIPAVPIEDIRLYDPKDGRPKAHHAYA